MYVQLLSCVAKHAVATAPAAMALAEAAARVFVCAYLAEVFSVFAVLLVRCPVDVRCVAMLLGPLHAVRL